VAKRRLAADHEVELREDGRGAQYISNPRVKVPDDGRPANIVHVPASFSHLQRIKLDSWYTIEFQEVMHWDGSVFVDIVERRAGPSNSNMEFCIWQFPPCWISDNREIDSWGRPYFIVSQTQIMRQAHKCRPRIRRRERARSRNELQVLDAYEHIFERPQQFLLHPRVNVLGSLADFGEEARI